MIKPNHLVLFLFVTLMVGACNHNKNESEKRVSPRIKKSTKIEQPVQNQSFTRGEAIPISITSNTNIIIDSIRVTVDDQTKSYAQSNFNITLPGKRVGTWKIQVKTFFKERTETHYRKVVVMPEDAPVEYSYSVENTYPHDTKDYTQGLLIHNGFIYESTGQRGQSALKKKNLTTGEIEQVIHLAPDFFGEGLAFLNNKFYQLTWTSGKALVYDSELNQTGTLHYQNQSEGWGLVAYQDQLIMTNGNEKIYFLDPATFTITKELEVYSNEGKIEALNELEVIDGLLYANIYQQDNVVVINPETGEVLKTIDFSGLLTSQEAQAADVLNGIAYQESTRKIFITGKWWPKLFEVTIQPKVVLQ